MHFLLSTVVKHVLKFKYGWCNAPLIWFTNEKCSSYRTDFFTLFDITENYCTLNTLFSLSKVKGF